MGKESGFETIRLDRDERGVATITMDRPADGNPMDEESIREMTLVAERLGEDDSVRVVVLTGEGNVFCAGGKPAFLEKLRSFSFAKNISLGGRLDRMYATLSGLPKPLIGRINGDAIGGGTGLTTTCDIAIAVEEARFGFSDVRVGIAPTVVAPYFVRKVGPSFARAAFISCEKFSARRASEIGLVHRVAPKADLDAVVEETIDSCLMGGPRAMAVAKRLPDIVQHGSEALRKELVEIVARLRETDEGREGLAALIESESPVGWQETKVTTRKRLFEVVLKATFGIAVLSVVGCASPSADAPDLILHSGKILTVNDGFEIAEALAIADGNIAAVGTDAEIQPLAGTDTTVFDLEGRTVIPGIVDAHSHQDGYGMHIYRADLSKVGSVAEMMSVVEAKVKQSQPGEWITNSGFWNETKLEERRNPTRFDIDPISPENPVYLGRGHLGIINTKAMEALGMDEDTPNPPGGTIERDEQGRITGRLYERALDPLEEAVPKPTHEQRMGAILQTYKEMAAAGATSVRSAGSPIESIAAYVELNDRGELPLRTGVTAYLNPNQSAEQIEAWLQRLPPASRSGDMFHVWGVKMTADGGSDLAYLRRDYANRPGFRGQLGGSLEDFTTAVSLCNQYGRRVGIHALGDAAIDFTLDAYEAADAEDSIVDKRWSIEHGYLIQPEQYPRMKRLGLIIHPQTWHLYHLRRNFLDNYGQEYADMSHPYRDLVDQGIPIAGGMDWRVAPYDYFFFMWVAITRKTLDGEVVGPDQALTREEALRFHTVWAAYSTFEEDRKGSLEPGKFADLAVLDNDYLGVEEDEIKDIRPLLTMVGGQVVFRDPDYTFP